MPVFHGDMHAAPAWCELSSYEIVHLPIGSEHRFVPSGQRERVIVAAGACHIAWTGGHLDAHEGTKWDIPVSGAPCIVQNVREASTVVRLCGHWGEETGGWGLFAVREVDDPVERGDPVDHPKRTTIDNHYHDFDEYWIILEGRGVVISEGTRYDVGPGDCVATGMGDHHDFPLAAEPVTAVYFETTLMGERRRGHLWNHTHGEARPYRP